MPDLASYEIIKSTDALHAFRPQWKRLWQQDRHATPFQSPEWLLPWWRQFGQPDLRAVVISQSGQPIALLPFYVYSKPETRERQLLLIGAGTTDYLDGIFAPGCNVWHVERALEMLAAQPGWDTLYASQLLPHSKLFQALDRRPEPRMRRFESESCSRMPAVPIPELPQKIRRNAMYYRNRAARRGALEFSVADESNWAAAFNALERLHTARWESRRESGVLSDPLITAWHREAIPELARAGLLRLCCLRLNGEIIGVLYSLLDPLAHPAPTQYFYVTAYSTQHADLRPGTLLLAFAVEHAALEGVATIDMLRGNEAYKQLWHMDRLPTAGFAWSSRASGSPANCSEEAAA